MYELLKRKLYQDNWNTINLVEVAKSKNLPMEKIASCDFYDEFYKRLKTQDFQIDEEWKNEKLKLSELTKNLFSEFNIDKTDKILSLGAGLGIVEEPLIREGWAIDLQECQEHSFDYIKRKMSCANLKIYVGSSLTPIPSNHYNLVLSYSISYVFDNKSYMEYLQQCFRVLKNNGLLFLWDPECRIPNVNDLKVMIKKILEFFKIIEKRKSDKVFWGYLRSGLSHKEFCRRAGFVFIKELNFEKNYLFTAYPQKLFGFTLPASKSHIQFFIFRKP